MYNPEDSITKAHSYIQGLRSKGHSYAGYPVYNVTKDDLRELMKVGDKYGIPFEWLINLINFETGRTFNPAITNSIGATGLIQFLSSTASGDCLRTTTAELRKMTFKQQLAYVDKYLACNLRSHLTIGGKIPAHFTQADLFMVIFYPVAVGRPDYVFPANVQSANSGIARPKDYANKALQVAVFPLSVFPYSLAEVKQRYGTVVTITKYYRRQIMVIGILLIIIAVLLLVFRKKVVTYVAKA